MLAALAGCSMNETVVSSPDSAGVGPRTVAPSGSSGQESELEQERLDNLWAEIIGLYPEAERPTTLSVVRRHNTVEWAEVQSRCLQDAGYAVEKMQDGGVSFARVTIQDQDFHVARYACEAQFPPEPHTLLPPSDADLESTYTYLTGPLTDCLEARGFPVPEPPSLDTFIDQQRSAASRVTWSPYAEVSQYVPQDEWLRLNEACPQVPPGQ